MNRASEKHLNEKQLCQAVVDDAALSSALRAHLSVCAGCRERKVRLEKELTILGQNARRFAPAPQGRVTLPAAGRQRNAGVSWWRTAAVGTVAAAALAVAVFWWNAPGPAPGGGKPVTAWTTADDERFMTEVQLLTENSLPQVYLDIAGETNLDIDEDFMRFVVPSVDDDSLSYDPENRRRVS